MCDIYTITERAEKKTYNNPKMVHNFVDGMRIQRVSSQEIIFFLYLRHICTLNMNIYLQSFCFLCNIMYEYDNTLYMLMLFRYEICIIIYLRLK